MLTGKQAFHGKTALSVVGSILHQPAPTLRQVAPQLDERFDAIVQRCLQKQPAERFASMAEVKSRLEELVEAQASPSRLSFRTHKLLMRWVLAAGAAALLCGAGVWMTSRKEPAREVSFSLVQRHH